MDRKEIKMILSGVTKHLVRIPDNNAKNSIFRTRDKDTPINGERCNAGNQQQGKW